MSIIYYRELGIETNMQSLPSLVDPIVIVTYSERY